MLELIELNDLNGGTHVDRLKTIDAKQKKYSVRLLVIR